MVLAQRGGSGAVQEGKSVSPFLEDWRGQDTVDSSGVEGWDDLY